MMRAVGRVVVGLLLVSMVMYVGDWLAFSIRIRQGGGWDTVEVSRMTTAALKGNKEAVYSDGTDSEACSRSMFPMPSMEGSTTPCWWLRRHAEIVVKH